MRNLRLWLGDCERKWCRLRDPDRQGHGSATALFAGHDHVHEHGSHDHQHHHETTAHGRIVSLEQDLLDKNQLFAERNRGWFSGRAYSQST